MVANTEVHDNLSTTEKVWGYTVECNTIKTKKDFTSIKDNQLWKFYSGCSHHICKDKSFFESLDETFSGEVTVANGQSVPIEGVGTAQILLKTNRGTVWLKLLDCYYVPKMNANLLSTRKLVKKKINIDFNNHGEQMALRVGD